MATTAADAFVADGALSMLMAELATCVKYGLRSRSSGSSTHRSVRSSGSRRSAECGLVRGQALATAGPALVQTVQDPLEPPCGESYAGSGRPLAPGEPESGEDRPNGAVGQAPRARLRSRWR